MHNGARRTDLILIGLVTLATAASCEEPAGNHGAAAVVAWVGDDAILRSELDEYLARNLLGAEGEVELEASLDDVKSRLLDALIDERLLAAEAERQGIEVTDVEVATYRVYGEAEEEDRGTEEEPSRPRIADDQIRRRLRVEKLQEQMIRRLVPPSDEEIQSFAEQHRQQLLPGRTVELRALQLRSAEVAARVYAEIRSRRLTFQEAVLAHEPNPGQTVPFRSSWSGLSSPVRAAVERLAPGGVSPPVELDGRAYLFEVVSWIEEPDDLGVELARRARQGLESEMRQQALDALVASLRSATRVRIKRGRLPFRYVSAVDR